MVTQKQKEKFRVNRHHYFRIAIHIGLRGSRIKLCKRLISTAECQCLYCRPLRVQNLYFLTFIFYTMVNLICNNNKYKI